MKYRIERRGFGLVEIKLRVPGKIDSADSVDVGFAFFSDTGTLSSSGGCRHVASICIRLRAM